MRFELETIEGKLAAEKTRVEGVTERCSLFEAQLKVLYFIYLFRFCSIFFPRFHERFCKIVNKISESVYWSLLSLFVLCHICLVKDAESRCLEYSQECGEKTVEIQKLETHVSQLQDERNRLLTRIEEIHDQFIRKEQKLNEEIRDLVASSDVASKSMITRELELKSFVRPHDIFSLLLSLVFIRLILSWASFLSPLSLSLFNFPPPLQIFFPIEFGACARMGG